MEARQRKPGSVRLTDEQYQEMDRLGIDNESAYVKYKLSTAQSKLAVLKPEPQESQVKTLPAVPNRANDLPQVEDKLTIQRLVLENQNLKNKLEEISESNQQTLSGVNQKVHAMLQDELMKRDFEAQKKQSTQQEKEIKTLEEKLEKSKKETEAKQEEIEALVKKLGLVELGKALLPGAISGLAKQYPNQMKGIAGTLGSIGLSHDVADENEEDKEYLLQILNHFTEVFTEEQFEQVMQLMVQLGERIKEDQQILQKVTYYVQQLKKKEKQ
ncbi:hypothetical protein J9332_06380 [Aquimarina celericrescens]|nr:hypothetical protein [Aquimarina celericrescens]